MVITLWAPYGKSVKLYSGDTFTPMKLEKNGWWSVEANLSHSEDYGFLINDKGPFPDPRSRWQPNGPHGLSRYYKQDFNWKDQQWSNIGPTKTVIYELHVGTFSQEGTFLSIIPQLSHLLQLGITHIELLPIASFSGQRGWGYDGVNLFAPHSEYGSPDDLKQLINTCHLNGIGVLLDVVYNHLGPSGNYLSQFGPYFHDNYHTPWGEAINFDGFDSPEVRRFFIDNALMWLDEFHFDGLRLDAVQTIMDGSAIHFLEELSSEINDLEQLQNRSILLIAESHMNDSRLMMKRDKGGFGLQSQWHDDFHHSIYAFFTLEQKGYFQDYGSIKNIATVFNNGVFFDGGYCKYRRCSLGRPAKALNGPNFIAYIQNHDQVGNRPGGERLSHLLNLRQLKITAAILLSSPFIPMLFQGEEWGASTPFMYFTDHQESHLAKSVKKGRKKEAKSFGWSLKKFCDPQSEQSFTQSKLNWSELCKTDNKELFVWYQKLLELRKKFNALQGGSFLDGGATTDEARAILQIKRGNLTVICNCSTKAHSYTIGPLQQSVILQSEEGFTFDKLKLSLPPESVIILEAS